jgi:nitroimidazol reductase NimA-like FMN-containing flavoprotein (pyridoxamine 5'-phosphate oxidase superfamily)
MFGTLTREQIEQTLHSGAIGRIGCHCEGLTYVVPVAYAYDGERIIAHSSEGMKLQMMRTNPRVCFQVDHIDNIGCWRSVITWGDFRELASTEAAQCMGFLIERLQSRQAAHASYHANSEPYRAVVFEISLVHKTGRFEQ